MADDDQKQIEPKEEVKEEKAKTAKTSDKEEKIITEIEKMSVLELANLVKALEEKFGVSAAPQMAMGAVSAQTSQVAESSEPAEEQTTFNVVLTAAGANKIGVIKALRELIPTLGLKEAKDLAEAAPKEVLNGVNKATAEEAKTKLTAAGATVELK